MKIHFILLAMLVASGCNLFRETTPVGSTPDASADSGPTDTGTDVSIASDSGGSEPDVSDPTDMTADTGSPSDVGRDSCVPETDAELCSQRSAECGEPRTVLDTISVTAAGPDMASSTCTPLDGFGSLCNTSATADLAFTAPQAGDYLAVLTAHDTSTSAVRALVEVQLDGAPVARLQNPYQEPDTGDLSFVIEGVTAGDHVVSWRMVYDAYVPEIGYDLNVRVASGTVSGPVEAVVDSCGTPRVIDCGTCGANEICGLARENQCDCPCPLDDGTCAPQGAHPFDICLQCTDEGWQGTTVSCDDGDACTVGDSCQARGGVCSGNERSCVGGACEDGTCENGACVFTPKPDDEACGATGVCQAGVCGCVGGPVVETVCGGNTDDDCDGLLNCEDPDCDGQSCGGQKTCVGGVCQ